MSVNVYVYPDAHARSDSLYILLSPSNARDPDKMREMLHKAMLEIALNNYTIGTWSEHEEEE
jgi:hypothetical protein